jgi:hypothetical protein
LRRSNPCRHTKNGWIASLAMTASRHAHKSRGAIRPRFSINFLNPPIRGRRECRAPMRRGKKCARSSHGHTGITRHSPRNGFTVSFVLSPAIGSFATVTCGTYRKLDTSVEVSGPHDFTVRKLHRPSRAPLRPPHPAPTFVTFANVPLSRTGRDEYRLICNFGKSEYFCQRGFTDFWVICPSGGFVESIEQVGRVLTRLARPKFSRPTSMDAGIQPVGQITAVPPRSLPATNETIV